MHFNSINNPEATIKEMPRISCRTAKSINKLEANQIQKPKIARKLSASQTSTNTILYLFRNHSYRASTLPYRTKTPTTRPSRTNISNSTQQLSNITEHFPMKMSGYPVGHSTPNLETLSQNKNAKHSKSARSYRFFY